MSEDEFMQEPSSVLATGEPVASTRGADRIATVTPAVPEPRANGAKINEIARTYGVPLAEGEPDPLLESLEAIRNIPPELDGDLWRD